MFDFSCFKIAYGTLTGYRAPGEEYGRPAYSESDLSSLRSQMRTAHKPVQVSIPEGVLDIGIGAFDYCNAVTRVVIPNTVKTIGAHAFRECHNLAEVVIPDSVTSIGSSAFADCTALWKIEIPDSVTEIGGGALAGCTSLESIRLPEALCTAAGKIFGNLDILAYSWMQGKVSVPPAMEKSLKSNLKRNWNAVTNKLVRGDNSAGMKCFLELWEKVPLSDLDAVLETASESQKPAVTALLMDYKNRMYGQRQREITERIQTEKGLGIRPRTIAEYRKLFRLGETDEGYVVRGYKGFAPVVEVPAEIGRKPVVAVEGWILKEECQTPYSIILPKGIKRIGDEAFYRCRHLTAITIPDSVTKIGRCAFEGCSSLTSITIPGSVRCIESYTFEDCTKLTQVTILPGVKKMEYSPFRGCSGLNVSIPLSVTDISHYAFDYNYQITITTPAGSCASRATRYTSVRVITV